MSCPSPGTTKRTRVAALAALSIVLGICALYVAASRTEFTPYSRFLTRDPVYYSNLVEACELLLQTAPVEIEYERAFAGTNPILPHIVWDLRPSRVEVLSRCKLVNDTRLLTLVRLHMGESRGGYSIICSAIKDESLWQLEAAEEG